MDDKLSIADVIQNGIQIALKNFVPLLVNAILGGLAMIVPYLNVGVLIGLITLPAKMAKDEPIGMTEVFDPKYRKYMGEFFLTYAFLFFGVLVATLFMVIPGYVLGIAWSLALLLVVDKGYGSIDALKKSNDLTYGHKWTIFLSYLAFGVALGVAVGILLALGRIPYIGWIFYLVILAIYIGAGPIVMGINAYIYKKLAINA